MCSRYYRFKDLKDLITRFKIAQILSTLGLQYNIAPTDLAVVIPATDNDRIAKDLIFGIINPFMKGKSSLLMNMRAESFVEKPHFRPYLLNQRCLVIADGFIEWERNKNGKKMKQSIPYRIDPRNHETVGLAGIWDHEGFVIITTEPNPTVAEIHDRAPVILRREEEDVWLDSNVKDFTKLITMLVPSPSDALEKAAISTLASNSKNKASEILIPVSGH